MIWQNSKEINEVLAENFDIRTIDVETLEPQSKQRVLELIRGDVYPVTESSPFQSYHEAPQKEKVHLILFFLLSAKGTPGTLIPQYRRCAEVAQ